MNWNADCQPKGSRFFALSSSDSDVDLIVEARHEDSGTYSDSKGSDSKVLEPRKPSLIRLTLDSWLSTSKKEQRDQRERSQVFIRLRLQSSQSVQSH